MISYLFADIIDIFYQFLYPFTRLSAFILSAPFFALESINVRFRIAISVTLTFFYFSFFDGLTIDPFTSSGLIGIGQEAMIGLILGFSLQLVSASITVGGQVISNAMGLGMANMFDPNLGNVPVISQFLIVLSTLIFMLLDGHLIIIDIIFRSFTSFPIGQPIPLNSILQAVVDFSPLIFTGGLLLALPMMITLLLVNIGLGVITRSAPSLNIIAVGFPAILLIGVIILILSLPGIIRVIQKFWLDSFDQLFIILSI